MQYLRHIIFESGNLWRHLITCSESVKQIYPKNVYELKKTLFDKMHAFERPYKKEKKFF